MPKFPNVIIITSVYIIHSFVIIGYHFTFCLASSILLSRSAGIILPLRRKTRFSCCRLQLHLLCNLNYVILLHVTSYSATLPVLIYCFTLMHAVAAALVKGCFNFFIFSCWWFCWCNYSLCNFLYSYI